MASKPHSAREAEPWTPADHPREALLEALIDGGVAGIVSHDRPNVLWKIRRLTEADPDLQFGLAGVDAMPFEEVLRLMAESSGFDPDPSLRHGLVRVDPRLVLDSFERIGDRLALAAERGESVLLATGHPTGLPILYRETGRLLAEHGAKLVRPHEGHTWTGVSGPREIRYVGGVAVLTDRSSELHTHSPRAMERILEVATPDLVFADHGFAGAAVQAGIDTVSIADVNDPALVVAAAQGRGGPVAVMDDNVRPEAYWPCFQVIAARFARRQARPGVPRTRGPRPRA